MIIQSKVVFLFDFIPSLQDGMHFGFGSILDQDKVYFWYERVQQLIPILKLTSSNLLRGRAHQTKFSMFGVPILHIEKKNNVCIFKQIAWESQKWHIISRQSIVSVTDQNGNLHIWSITRRNAKLNIKDLR